MRRTLQLDVFYSVDGLVRILLEKLRCYRDISQFFLQFYMHLFFTRFLQVGFGGHDYG